MPPGCSRGMQYTAVVIYTSGTTGRPKGAELTHIGLYMNADIPGRLFDLRPDDVVITALPLFQVFGLSSILNVCVRFGCTMSLISRFDAETALTAIQLENFVRTAQLPLGIARPSAGLAPPQKRTRPAAAHLAPAATPYARTSRAVRRCLGERITRPASASAEPGRSRPRAPRRPEDLLNSATMPADRRSIALPQRSWLIHDTDGAKVPRSDDV
jgi:hypothetical protein